MNSFNKIFFGSVCRHCCIYLLPTVLVAIVCVLPIVTCAQSEPAATSSATVQGIPLAEIASRAEHIKRPLSAITRRLSVNIGAGSLSGQVQAAEERIAAQSQQLNERLASKPTLYELRELDRDWKVRSVELGTWQKTLAQSLTSTESDLRWLKEERARWSATLDQLTGSDSLEAVFDRIKSVLSELQRLQTLVQERLNYLFAFQDRVSQLDFLVSTRLDDLASARKDFQETLLVRDSRPLWLSFSDNGETAQGQMNDSRGRSYTHELAAARESIEKQKSRFFLLLLLFVAILLVNISLAKRIDPLTDGNPELRESAAILKRPVSAALLIILLLQLWLSPLSASLVNSVVALLLLIPFLQIVRNLFELPAWMRISFFIMAILYLSDQIRFLADFEPLVERLIFLAETAVAIAVLVWMIRPKRFDSLPVPLMARQWLRGALTVMLGLVSLSLLANLFGFVTLAKVLGEGALHSAYLGALMYVAARVINVGMALMLKTNHVQASVFVQFRQNEIVKWFSRIIYSLAGVLWVFGSLELFTIREQFLAMAERVWDASLSFRSLRVSAGDVVSFLVVVALAYYLSKVVRLILQEDVLARMPLERGVPKALAIVAQYILLFGGFVLAVGAAGFDLNRLTLLTGAFGVGIGFGLQNIVNNFVSGLILLFERPIQIGDAVQVGSVVGEITRIGIRSSTIRTYNGAEVIVPNAKLISDEVTNWTLSSKIRRVALPVGVAYGSDHAQVMDILLAEAKTHPEVLAEPEPQVLFTDFADSSLQFELRFWVPNELHPLVKSQVALAVSDALAKAGIQIPFPQRDLRVRLDDETLQKILAAQDK